MESYLLTALIAIWPLSEIILGLKRRAHAHGVKSAKSSYGLIWLVIIGSVFSAMFIQNYLQLPIPGSSALHLLLGGVLIILGLLLRWIAILILGNSFVVDVAVKQGQRIIQRGPYKYLRHPSYTGMILSFLGLGLLLGNWVSLFLIIVPITAVLIYRIRSEEELLAAEFGAEYLDYSKKTHRLFPGMY